MHMVLSSFNLRELVVNFIAFDAAVMLHENVLLKQRFIFPQLFYKFIYNNQYPTNYLQY